MSARYLVCHLPDFRLERCGWEPRQSVVLVAEQRNALRVQAPSQRAVRAGIAAGMTLAQARALLPELQVELLEPEAEQRDLLELSHQLHRIAPAVAPLPPQAVVAELASPAGGPRLSIAERDLLERARTRLEALGHRVQVVVADDLFAARVLAAWGGRDRVVPPGGVAAALAPLPLRALGPSLRLAASLRDLGLRHVGDLARLSPADVSGRFGAEALRLHRLARGVRGSLPLTVREQRGQLELSWELPFPIAAVEPLLFVLNRACGDLCTQLEQAGQALVALALILVIDDAGELRLALRTGRPLRDPEPIARLLRRRLESLQLAGPVLALRLEACPVPFAGAQEPLLEGGRPLEPLAGVAARLADGLGSAALHVPGPRDRWRPEAAWAPESLFDARGRFLEAAPALLASDAGQQILPASSKQGGKELDPAWPHEAWRLRLPCPRPTLLLPEPRPVILEPRLGPPRRVQLEGRWLEVRHRWGPEWLVGEWWAAGLDRRYWALELSDGRGLWVFRELGHAYLHGLFDQGSPSPMQPGRAS